MPVHLVPQHDIICQRAQFTIVTLSQENSTHILWTRNIANFECDCSNPTLVSANARYKNLKHCTKQTSQYMQQRKNVHILNNLLTKKWKTEGVDWQQRKLVMMGVLTQNCIGFCSDEKRIFMLVYNVEEWYWRKLQGIIVLVTSSWNVYKCIWWRVICHSSQKKKAVCKQHF